MTLRDLMPLRKGALYEILNRFSDPAALRQAIERDLQNHGLRLGMACSVSHRWQMKRYPYPTLLLTLVDKSRDPYVMHKIRYDGAGARLEASKEKVRLHGGKSEEGLDSPKWPGDEGPNPHEDPAYDVREDF